MKTYNVTIDYGGWMYDLITIRCKRRRSIPWIIRQRYGECVTIKSIEAE